MYIHTYICMNYQIHTYMHTYIHAYKAGAEIDAGVSFLVCYIQTYIHTYTHTYIHAYKAGGLGNRLGSTLSGMLIAALTGRALIVYSDLNDYIQVCMHVCLMCVYTELFFVYKYIHMHTYIDTC